VMAASKLNTLKVEVAERMVLEYPGCLLVTHGTGGVVGGGVGGGGDVSDVSSAHQQ
jgi:hypothetical protein